VVWSLINSQAMSRISRVLLTSSSSLDPTEAKPSKMSRHNENRMQIATQCSVTTSVAGRTLDLLVSRKDQHRSTASDIVSEPCTPLPPLRLWFYEDTASPTTCTAVAAELPRVRQRVVIWLVHRCTSSWNQIQSCQSFRQVSR